MKSSPCSELRPRFFTHSRIFFVVGSVFAFFAVMAASAQEIRTWTDKASGKTIEAAYISADATSRTVTIKNAAGQEFTLPVARLNDADIAYIRQKLTAPAAPAATAPATPAAAPASAATPAAAPAAKVAKAAPKGQPAPPKPELKILPHKGFKAPSAVDFVRSAPKSRPRLVQNAQGWASLKDMVAKDPVAQKMLDTLKKNGEFLLAKPEMSYIYLADGRGVNPGSQTLFRIALLGALHFIDGDPKWRERGVREMVSVTDKAYGDWYPQRDNAEVTKDHLIAGVLAYDWFKEGFNAEQIKHLREFIHQKGVDVLVAHLKGEPPPATAKKVEPGQAPPKDTKTPAKPGKKNDDDDEHITAEEVGMCAALIMTSICMADDDPQLSKKALEGVGKTFAKGVMQFSPGGVWPEGLEAGDQALDDIILVLQTMRANGLSDFGLSMLEGVPSIGLARMHLTGPTGQIFNYGDVRSAQLSRRWITSWLSGVHGNPGVPTTAALPGKSAEGVNTAAFLDVAGQMMYHNPQSAGYGTPASSDFVAGGGEAAALRSAWDDPAAFYIAMKGGKNEIPTAQLDIGSFVLDAGGVRWGIELGTENDRVAGVKPAADRTKRYGLYVEGTQGQNTLVFGGGKDEEKDDKNTKKAPANKYKQQTPTIPGCQDLDAKAAFIGFNSSPEKGVAVLDMTDAYHKAKSAHRGAMMVRGAQPYVLLQDDLVIKGTSDVDWQMHTKSEIAASGTKATLTQGKATLTASLLSPAGAEFVVDDPPEKPPGDTQNRDLRKESIKVLKVKLKGVKGEQRIAVAFALGADTPAPPVVPLTQWLPKK